MSYTIATTYLLAFMPDDSVMAPQYMGFATEESARDSDFLRKAISMGVSDRYNGGRLDLIKTVVWSNSNLTARWTLRFLAVLFTTGIFLCVGRRSRCLSRTTSPRCSRTED